MTIISDDEVKMVDVGTSDTLRALYSTALILLKDSNSDIELGLEFLRTGNCTAGSAEESAKQIEAIKKGLSSFNPKDAVYDYRDLKKEAPWKDNISEHVTSCANLFTTADGKDLLLELIDILNYASIKVVSVETLG